MTNPLFHVIRSRQFREILGPFLAFFCVTYFVYHGIQGDRGLLSLFRTKQKIETVKAELNLLQAQKETLERRVYLLRPDSLDLDLLEERARAILNFGRSDEVVIFEEPSKEPSSFEKTPSSQPSLKEETHRSPPSQNQRKKI